VTFTISTIPDVPDLDYQFDAGDGSPIEHGNARTIRHTYRKPSDSYTASVTLAGARSPGVAKLTIRAPEDGIIVPPPSRPPQERDRLQLASWSGRPLDVRNVGAFLEPSTLICKIAQPGKLEAILAVEQEELDFVRPGQAVDLLLASHPGLRLPGRIDHIAEQNMDAAPMRLAARAGGAGGAAGARST